MIGPSSWNGPTNLKNKFRGSSSSSIGSSGSSGGFRSRLWDKLKGNKVKAFFGSLGLLGTGVTAYDIYDRNKQTNDGNNGAVDYYDNY